MAKKKSKMNRGKAQPKRKYVKKHEDAISEWDRRHPEGVDFHGKTAVEAVAEYKWKIDDALRRFKRSKYYKRQKELYIEMSMIGEEANMYWVPKEVARIKEYENYAVHWDTDPEGKRQLNPNNLLKLAELAETVDVWSEGQGYVSYKDIFLMADALGRDVDEMLNYNLFQMKEAIHEFYSTGHGDDDDFGYVEVGRR